MDLCDERNDLPKQHRWRPHPDSADEYDNAVVDLGWQLAMCDNEESGVETVSGDSVIAATRGSKGHSSAEKRTIFFGPTFRTGQFQVSCPSTMLLCQQSHDPPAHVIIHVRRASSFSVPTFPYKLPTLLLYQGLPLCPSPKGTTL